MDIKAAGYIVFDEDALIVGWGPTLNEAMNSVQDEDKSLDLMNHAASSLLLSEIAECGPDSVSWLTCEVDGGGELAIDESEQQEADEL